MMFRREKKTPKRYNKNKANKVTGGCATALHFPKYLVDGCSSDYCYLVTRYMLNIDIDR